MLLVKTAIRVQIDEIRYCEKILSCVVEVALGRKKIIATEFYFQSWHLSDFTVAKTLLIRSKLIIN